MHLVRGGNPPLDRSPIYHMTKHSYLHHSPTHSYPDTHTHTHTHTPNVIPSHCEATSSFIWALHIFPISLRPVCFAPTAESMPLPAQPLSGWNPYQSWKHAVTSPAYLRLKSIPELKACRYQPSLSQAEIHTRAESMPLPAQPISGWNPYQSWNHAVTSPAYLRLKSVWVPELKACRYQPSLSQAEIRTRAESMPLPAQPISGWNPYGYQSWKHAVTSPASLRLKSVPELKACRYQPSLSQAEIRTRAESMPLPAQPISGWNPYGYQSWKHAVTSPAYLRLKSVPELKACRYQPSLSQAEIRTRAESMPLPAQPFSGWNPYGYQSWKHAVTSPAYLRLKSVPELKACRYQPSLSQAEIRMGTRAESMPLPAQPISGWNPYQSWKHAVTSPASLRLKSRPELKTCRYQPSLSQAEIRMGTRAENMPLPAQPISGWNPYQSWKHAVTSPAYLRLKSRPELKAPGPRLTGDQYRPCLCWVTAQFGKYLALNIVLNHNSDQWFFWAKH